MRQHCEHTPDETHHTCIPPRLSETQSDWINGWNNEGEETARFSLSCVFGIVEAAALPL